MIAEAFHSLDRERSQAALLAVQDLKRHADDLPGLPILLRTQGLAAGLSVHDSGFGPRIIEWLAAWSKRCRGPAVRRDRFWDDYLKLSAAEAAAVEDEALRYAEQLKLFGKLLK